MANAVNVNFRMDPDLKRSMEEVCAEMGLSMTTAFTIFAKKVSREHRIPFEVSADPFYAESNINHLRQIVHDIDNCLWQTRDKKLLKRINTLLKDIQRNTYEGIGKPEPLKGDLSGWWSRRIDDTHRIVYKEQDGNIIIASCFGHYDDT